jgi:OmcA/MtrC family decaheme c-type cytochrome
MLGDTEKCKVCHYRIQFHQGRTQAEYCPTCHAPDYTDWSRRTKYAAGDAPSPALVGTVNLGSTFDGIEERSLHFKVLIHRIHTGGRSGPASLQLTRPYTAGGSKSTSRFRDMGEFPNDLAKCTLCHASTCYRVEMVPADAAGTLANETPTIMHSQPAPGVTPTSAHGADEVPVPPVTAACMGCHATAYAQAHTAKYITAGKEQCVSCHGAKGSYSVERTHGLPVEN